MPLEEGVTAASPYYSGGGGGHLHGDDFHRTDEFHSAVSGGSSNRSLPPPPPHPFPSSLPSSPPAPSSSSSILNRAIAGGLSKTPSFSASTLCTAPAGVVSHQASSPQPPLRPARRQTEASSDSTTAASSSSVRSLSRLTTFTTASGRSSSLLSSVASHSSCSSPTKGRTTLTAHHRHRSPPTPFAHQAAPAAASSSSSVSVSLQPASFLQHPPFFLSSSATLLAPRADASMAGTSSASTVSSSSSSASSTFSSSSALQQHPLRAASQTVSVSAVAGLTDQSTQRIRDHIDPSPQELCAMFEFVTPEAVQIFATRPATVAALAGSLKSRDRHGGASAADSSTLPPPQFLAATTSASSVSVSPVQNENCVMALQTTATSVSSSSSSSPSSSSSSTSSSSSSTSSTSSTSSASTSSVAAVSSVSMLCRGGSSAASLCGKASLDVSSLDLLECAICTETVEGIIYQCKQGHVLCSVCQTKVNVCPVCRSGPVDIRCRLLEEILRKVDDVNCKFNRFGCPQTVKYSTKRDHESRCMFKPFQCLHTGCDFEGSSEALVEHLVESHGYDRIYDTKIAFVCQKVNITKVIAATASNGGADGGGSCSRAVADARAGSGIEGTGSSSSSCGISGAIGVGGHVEESEHYIWQKHVYSCYDKHFLLRVHRRVDCDPQFYISVAVLHNKHHSNRYTVSTSGNHRKYTFEGPVWSIRKGFREIERVRDCLILPENIALFLSGGKGSENDLNAINLVVSGEILPP